MNGESTSFLAQRRRCSGGVRLAAMMLAWFMAMAAASASPRLLAEPVDPVTAATVKADFLVNFLRYTTFPDEPPPLATSPYQLIIVGDEALTNALAVASETGVTVNTRGLRVQGLLTLDPQAIEQRLHDDGRLDLLYVGAQQHYSVPEIIAALERRPVLTVGEVPGFIAAGGMIRLHVEGGNIVFDANPDAVRASGLTLSAKVLKLARNLQDPTLLP